jgi:hypothetical protein
MDVVMSVHLSFGERASAAPSGPCESVQRGGGGGGPLHAHAQAHAHASVSGLATRDEQSRFASAGVCVHSAIFVRSESARRCERLTPVVTCERSSPTWLVSG